MAERRPTCERTRHDHDHDDDKTASLFMQQDGQQQSTRLSGDNGPTTSDHDNLLLFDDQPRRRRRRTIKTSDEQHKSTRATSLNWRRTKFKLVVCLLLLLLAACSLSSALVVHVGQATASRRIAGAAPVAQQVYFLTRAPNVTKWKRATDETPTTTSRRSAKLLEVDALNYLQRYGYMNQSASSGVGGQLISEDSFQEAIMQFQRFAGIPETGSVDAATLRYMQMPRCGNKDLSGKGENGKRKRRRRRRRRRRKKRYALQGSKWRRQELTYRISQYPTRFAHKKHEVDGQIEKAFRIWSQVAPIDFVVKREGRVHIDIRFASGEHGDGDPFDGPGNTLAHAYFPQYGGDAHFDDQEYWTVDSYTGTNIFQVAAHELGHSLGLGHSSVREALMAPFYQKYKPNFKLHADDVLGIQSLYGERDDNNDSPSTSSTSTTTSSTTTSTTSTTTESSVGRRRPPPDDGDGDSFFGPKAVDLCQDSRIDTITRTEDGNTYVFRGQHYWLIKSDGLATSGYPARISRDWDGLPGNLDAALTWSDGKTFFFKGDKYWRFFNKRREPGYPKQISVGFAGIPNNLDAAFVWSGNGKTYFFKRDKYWRFDSKQEPPVSGQYPKPIKNWVGLPASGLDGAFKWENGMTYFFKDELYYRFDDRQFEVDSSARPAFPRSTAEWWFGCTESNLPIKRRRDRDDEDEEAGQESALLFHRKPTITYEKPSGGSISRSIFSTLSALLPSSLTSSNSNSDTTTDWSFHKGVGEEVRRVGGGPRATRTRWSFPLGAGGSSEQSLSELRLEAEELRSAGRVSANVTTTTAR